MDHVAFRKKLGTYGVAFIGGWLGTTFIAAQFPDTIPTVFLSIGPMFVGILLTGIVYVFSK